MPCKTRASLFVAQGWLRECKGGDIFLSACRFFRVRNADCDPGITPVPMPGLVVALAQAKSPVLQRGRVPLIEAGEQRVDIRLTIGFVGHLRPVEQVFF